MNFDIARQQMISQQIRTWDVLDERVLEALRSTRREAFVPESERDLAFADMEIPLPHGQCMMTPKVEARLLQELAIEPIDSVLEIGTGSGYLTACLAKLGEAVTSLEIFADLSESAGSTLQRQGFGNIELRAEDAMEADFADSYDVIAITASMPTRPQRFIDLLRPEGRLFVVVGRAPVMEAMLVRRHADGNFSEQSLFETVLTPMINADASEPFVL